MSTPFTVLTGFLGAGKTTVLNRLLAAPRGRRIAVLVNELGRVAIDSKLILGHGGDVLELAGGCVCCAIDVKNDLWDGIADVVDRSRPDHVVLETTGIAEPAAILRGLAELPASRHGRVVPAGVVCVVDADAGLAQLERHAEARAQVETADRLMLSKLDLAAPTAVAALHDRLRALNPAAERAAFPATDEGTAALVPWLLEPRARAGLAPAGRGHDHDHGQLVAATFVDAAPLAAEPLLALVEQLRGRLIRVKGFVHIAGEPRRAYLELAGNTLQLRRADPWGTDPPTTELVFIGDALDEPAIRRALWACRTATPG